MKILWLSHLIPYPPKGGVLQRSYNLVRQVAKKHQLDLLAFNQKNLIQPLFADYEEGLKEATRELSTFCNRFQYLPIPCDQHPFGKTLLALKSLFTKAPYTTNWLQSLAMEQTLKAWLTSEDYDLIHFDTISLAPYLRHIEDKATSLDHHNIESKMLLRRVDHESNFFKKLYFFQEGKRLENYEKVVCPKFDLNITCSELDSTLLNKAIANLLVEEIPNGVDIEYFKADSDDTDANRLAFAGTMNYYPNIEAINWFIDNVWQQLKEIVPDVQFDLIGANPPQNFIELSKQDPQFKTHGFVQDVRPFLSRASLYVCPIQDGGGTKLKILDALAMSKAIICHPEAAEGIHVTNKKNIVFAQSAAEYLEKIPVLLKDRSQRIALGKEARALVLAEYAYEMIGSKLSLAFENIVAHKKRETACVE